MDNEVFQNNVLDILSSLSVAIDEVNDNIPIPDSDWTTPSTPSVTSGVDEQISELRSLFTNSTD